MTEQPQRDERDLNEFWWKIGSVAIAVMVWFIITTVAGLSYTNRGRTGKQPVLNPPTTNTMANNEWLHFCIMVLLEGKHGKIVYVYVVCSYLIMCLCKSYLSTYPHL